MSRAKRVRRIIELTSSELSDAERRLRQSATELQAYERQLVDLEAGRVDYARRLEHQGSGSIGVAEARTLLNFLQRLDEAIVQLRELIAQKHRMHDHHREQWIKTRNKTQVMADIANRFEEDDSADLRRLEQRELDDIRRAAATD
jgi:flagellar export protein FliJ